MAAADELGHEWLGPEHLLVALLRIESPACAALNACGVTDVSALGEIHRLGPNGAAAVRRKRCASDFRTAPRAR